MVRIYTRTGDAGETGLFGNARVKKNNPRVGACGEVDELSAHIGFARALGLATEIDGWLESVQRNLFVLGAELACLPPRPLAMRALADADVAALEQWIDQAESELRPLEGFVLPGGTAGGAALHVARCVCRRAERVLVGLAEESPVRPELLRYVNRLADLLFVLARLENARAGRGDVPWRP